MSDALEEQRGRSGERGAYLGGFVLDLVVGETERGHAGEDVGAVPAGVPNLCRRRAVITKAVRLHDQTQLGPEKVDFEAVDDLLGEGSVETSGGSYRSKEDL
jgi:hypothetical protein